MNLTDNKIAHIVNINRLLLGYPIYTLRTNLQCNFGIVKLLEKPNFLYKGITYQFMVNIIVVESYYKFLFKRIDKSGNFGYNNFMLCRFCVINSILITPLDYKKILCQTKYNIHEKYHYEMILDFKQNFINKFKLFYSGYIYTVIRNFMFLEIYFNIFSKTRTFFNNDGITISISSVCAWLFTYPIDTIKTRKQLYPHLSFVELLKGNKNLFNGLTITLLFELMFGYINFNIYKFIKANNN